MSVAVDCSAGEAVDIRVESRNGSLHWNETDGIEEFFNVVIKLTKNAGKVSISRTTGISNFFVPECLFVSNK